MKRYLPRHAKQDHRLDLERKQQLALEEMLRDDARRLICVHSLRQYPRAQIEFQ